MPQYAQEGQKVRLKDGTMAVVKNGQLVAATSAPGSPVPRKLSVQEQNFLNGKVSAAEEGMAVKRDYDEADAARKRLGTGPFWGSVLGAALPDEDGGILDKLGTWVIGAPLRATGALSDKDTTDYQTLKRVQARRVLAEQKQQKGVQTEGDAARIKAGDMSPLLTSEANAAAIKRGRAESQILIDRADFLIKWANKYGVNGTNENGQSAMEVFNALSAQRRGGKAPASAPTIRRIK